MFHDSLLIFLIIVLICYALLYCRFLGCKVSFVPIDQGAVKGNNIANTSCRDVWTEYNDMGVSGIKAVADYKVYTANDIIDLLHYVAPKMMARGDAHYSYGIADDLNDPKYQHYRYWSNPLETKYNSSHLYSLSNIILYYG